MCSVKLILFEIKSKTMNLKTIIITLTQFASAVYD